MAEGALPGDLQNAKLRDRGLLRLAVPPVAGAEQVRGILAAAAVGQALALALAHAFGCEPITAVTCEASRRLPSGDGGFWMARFDLTHAE